MVDHDAAANFVASEHIDHTSVTLTLHEMDSLVVETSLPVEYLISILMVRVM